MNNRGIQFGCLMLWLWLFLIPSMFFSLAFSDFDVRSTEAGLICGSAKYPDVKLSIQVFVSQMNIIAKLINQRGGGYHSSNDKPFAMFALAECHRDLQPEQCFSCFKTARELLPHCLPAISGRVFTDGCFLRYDDYNFYNESMSSREDRCDCQGPLDSLRNNESLKLGFEKQVTAVVRNVKEAASKRRFAVGGERGRVEGVFALAQCWETLEMESCRDCLHLAAEKIKDCVPGAGGRCLYTGCFLRYSTNKFYNSAAESHINDHRETSRIGVIIAGILAGIGLVFFISVGVLLSCQGTGQSKPRSKNNGSRRSLSSEGDWNFRYEFLEKATDNFDPSRKVGQGGAGSVYKGTLPSGRTIAVKRLFFNKRQWADGFFNEVNSISGIEHKNLVKLVGCSIEGPESLLVYEYLPNRSLDQVLFDKGSADALTWEQRFQIICGIAEGLAYLHGGCGTKIIHRDIKASNILLDDNLVPKIADFGLARFIASNKSHISTGIAGTLGYMAPEYLMRGQLTEKADVYALGVLIIEILCGQKSSICTEGSSSVLHRVWKNYKAGQITASVDPTLSGNFCVEEASNAIHVGLLCVQSSVSQRPIMADVLQMLTNKDHAIPSPKHQPFLNSSVLSPDDRTKTSTMSFLNSNRHLIVGVDEDSSPKNPTSSTSSEHATPENSIPCTTVTVEAPSQGLCTSTSSLVDMS